MRGGQIEIRMLGELEIRRDGERLDLPASKKTRALFGYLVATRRPHTRQHLCELLWDVPDDPRAALRWSLTKIRPLVDSDETKRLVADREHIAFEPFGAEIDLESVQAEAGDHLDRASCDALKHAAETFRGEFLEGLDMPDCYGYREWWVSQREAVRSKRVEILTELLRRLRGTPEEALKVARQWVAIDPLVEAGHVEVIRLLSELGRPKEAMAQYEACRRILDQELKAPRSQELEQARIAISRAVSNAPAAPGPGPAATVVAQLGAPRPSGKRERLAIPLIGRARERLMLERLLARLREGSSPPPVALLEGDPGIGKTRLLEELADMMRAAGGRVLGARAFEAEMVRPYGVWVDALRSIDLSRSGSGSRWALAALLPELGADAPATVGGAGDRNRLFDAVTELLLDLSKDQPLALILDDIQWIDEASAALAHYVTRALAASGAPPSILIALATRKGELDDNPAALRLVRALARESGLEELELSPLDAQETAVLAGAIDRRIDAGAVFEDSQGNPLFAIELSRAFQRGEKTGSENLEDLIGDRLERLGDRAIDLLPWAAALGRSFSLDLLAQAQGATASDVIAAVDELERYGVIRAHSGSSGSADYDFVHDLVRRSAYRRLSEPRRRLIHLRIARALMPLIDRDRAIAGDVAHHAALGGDDELAATACIKAGRRCLRLFAYQEAEQLVKRGTKHVQRLPQETRLHLHMDLLMLYFNPTLDRARIEQVDQQVRSVIAEAQDLGLQGVVALGYRLRLQMKWFAGDLDAACETSLKLSETGRAVDREVAIRSMASAASCFAQVEREIPKARALIADAMRLADRGTREPYELYWGSGCLAYVLGDHDAAIPLLERGIELVKSDENQWPGWDALIKLVMIELENRRYGRAIERAKDALQLAAKMGEGSEMPFSEALAALARLGAGQPGALELVEEKLARLERIDARAFYAYALATAADLELAQGRSQPALRRAEQALAEAMTVGRRSEIVWARVLLARGAMERGDIATARSHLEAIRPDVAKSDVVRTNVRKLALDAGDAAGLHLAEGS